MLALVAWLMAGVVLPRDHPQEPASHLWLAGLSAALLLFVSVLVHELSHSLVARALGLRVLGITLFLFGGLSSLASDPDDAWTEMKVAVAGPLVSFFAGAFFLVLRAAAAVPQAWSPVVASVFGYLMAWNLMLGAFNLLPGFPLDGGRVLRGIWWLATGSASRATRAAARGGSVVAFGLAALGGAQVLAGGMGGLWLVAIGLFLWTAAGAAGREGIMREALAGTTVGEIMIRDPISIAADATMQEAAERFLERGHAGFPVERDGEVCGLLRLSDLDDIPARRRPWVAVREVMTPLESLPTVSPSDPVRAALQAMAGPGPDRLLVVSGGAVVGMITEGNVRRFLRLRRLREEAEN